MHLAQLNVGRLRQPTDHPDTAEFMEALDPINALADASPGFVWRLQTDDGNATSIITGPDPLFIVNMSVWENPETLRDFVFRSAHTPYLRRRSEWFTVMDRPVVVGWWVDEGHQPDVDEALHRLAFFTEHGSSPYAFGLTRPEAQLSIRRVALHDAHAQALIGELNAELSDRYPEPGANHFRLDPAETEGDRGAFLLAELAGEPIACGAFRVLDDHPEPTAEIKRMYVRPTARGLKVGAAILAELERAAAAVGVRRMVLETGERQPEAIARYQRAGYAPCPSWGEYLDSPTSVCFAKPLVDASAT